jgi:hypothetical protein
MTERQTARPRASTESPALRQTLHAGRIRDEVFAPPLVPEGVARNEAGRELDRLLKAPAGEHRD